ncbi:hypothetical protein PCANB_000172 [Pneumocystis canis]|nr:hypothetical protein PCK1_000050 [Pneumocystis canis]KAG5439890.1 hypothetical protein PCANB_000172 [Pneumocystis canis]
MENSRSKSKITDTISDMNTSFSNRFSSFSRNRFREDTNNMHEQFQNKLFESPPPKYDQHAYINEYKSNFNRSPVRHTSESYEPYNNEGSSEEEVEAIKQEMRFIKQDSLSSIQNALRTAIQAEETGRHTLEKLGVQSERIGNTEKHMDLTAVNAKIAEEKNRALNQLNRSVFLPHFKKPWKKQARLEEKEQRIRNQYELEQIERERTKKSNYESFRRIKDTLYRQKNIIFDDQTPNNYLQYRFEPDEEDDEIENEIDQNLIQLGNITAQLKAIANATQEEIMSQNNRLDRISEKGHKLNAEIHINAERLKRIN